MADIRFCGLAKRQSPSDVPAALRIRLCVAICKVPWSWLVLRWGIWLRLVGGDCGAFGPHDREMGWNQQLVDQLKERFAGSEEWAGLAEESSDA